MADDNDTKEPELNANNDTTTVAEAAGMGRKEKRKLLKKLKRKQLRRDAAIKERENEEAELNDPEVQSRLLRLEKEEAERMERDRLEFEERERLFVLELELKKKRRQEEEEAAEKEEEEARKKRDLVSDGDENDLNESNDWEYVEEGPAEIIWKGNEIIVKKKKVKVLKKAPDLQIEKQESERPISNPLAPQSEAFKDYRTAQEVLDSVAQQVPNFGTEKDKAHCPFHLKTGACRFGPRCSRAHFYPDKSCTLLIKNMYSGPGLAWEQDEGLEIHNYTDDEAERSFEEFYEDVHTEFLKFGEIVNFKVCKNASSHLRGNVYVHFKLLESAVLAYQSINGRYFAGKQLSCEFVNLTKWRIAICGEYMKSGLKTCSRGSVCNFIHCFRNPGGDYEWADWDKPAPRYWVKEMAALFGCTGDRCTDESLRYRSNSSRSRGPDSPHRKSHFDENDTHKSKYLQRNRGDYEENTSSAENYRIKRRRTDSVSKPDDDREEHNSRSRGPDSPHRKSHFDENDSHKSKYLQRNRGDYEDKTSSAENYRIKRWRTDSVSKSDDDSEERNSRPRTSNLKKESDTKLTGQVSRKREERRGKKEEYSSDIDSIGDSLLRDKRLCIKDDRYLSDSNSNGRRLGRDRRSQKNTKRTSTSKDKSEHRELQKSDSSLERDDDNCRYHGANSSRALKSNSKAVLNGVRTETDEKRHQKDRGKSRSDNQGDFIDSETERFHDRTDGRRHRSSKNHKRVKHEAETSDDASDGGTSRRYKKERRKDKRTSSRSKKHGLDSLDVPSNVRSLNREDRHDGYGKRNKSNEETAVSQTVKVLLDDKVDADLEETYRNAALKKLEEMKKCKEPLHIQCKKLNTSEEIDSHEDIVVKDAGGCKYLEELSTSREAETSTASARRKRI